LPAHVARHVAESATRQLTIRSFNPQSQIVIPHSQSAIRNLNRQSSLPISNPQSQSAIRTLNQQSAISIANPQSENPQSAIPNPQGKCHNPLALRCIRVGASGDVVNGA
jgi:hypothetical protein